MVGEMDTYVADTVSQEYQQSGIAQHYRLGIHWCWVNRACTFFSAVYLGFLILKLG